MFEAFEKTLKEHMDKAFATLKHEFARLRSGRATPALLDGIRVDYYGTPTALNQMASINVPEPRLLVVQPWDQSSLATIEKAIQKSDLGLTPQNDGKIIRLPIPALTEDRRKDLTKVIHKHGEDCRIAIRNIRRTGMEDLKKMEKDKKISQDDHKREEKKVQEMTDGYIKKVDESVEGKSKEILEL